MKFFKSIILLCIGLLSLYSASSQTFGDPSGALVWEVPSQIPSPDPEAEDASKHGFYTLRWFRDTYEALRPGDTSMTAFLTFSNLNATHDTMVNRGFTGVNNVLTRSYSGFPDSLIALIDEDNNSLLAFNAHGSNAPDFIARTWGNVAVSCGTMAADTSGNINGFGPGLDFVIYDPCLCQSASTPIIAAIFAAVKDSLQDARNAEVDWWEVMYRLQETAYRDETTHPGGTYPNQLNGYGIPDFGAAVAFTGSIPPDPFVFVPPPSPPQGDSIPTLSILTGKEMITTTDGRSGNGNAQFPVEAIWTGAAAIGLNGIYSGPGNLPDSLIEIGNTGGLQFFQPEYPTDGIIEILQDADNGVTPSQFTDGNAPYWTGAIIMGDAYNAYRAGIGYNDEGFLALGTTGSGYKFFVDSDGSEMVFDPSAGFNIKFGAGDVDFDINPSASAPTFYREATPTGSSPGFLLLGFGETSTLDTTARDFSNLHRFSFTPKDYVDSKIDTNIQGFSSIYTGSGGIDPGTQANISSANFDHTSATDLAFDFNMGYFASGAPLDSVYFGAGKIMPFIASNQLIYRDGLGFYSDHATDVPIGDRIFAGFGTVPDENTKYIVSAVNEQSPTTSYSYLDIESNGLDVTSVNNSDRGLLNVTPTGVGLTAVGNTNLTLSTGNLFRVSVEDDVPGIQVYDETLTQLKTTLPTDAPGIEPESFWVHKADGSGEYQDSDKYGRTVSTFAPSTQSQVIDLDSSFVGVKQLDLTSVSTGSALALTVNNPISGGSYVFHFRNGSGHTVDLPANFLAVSDEAAFDAGTSISVTGGVFVVCYYDGTNFYCK